MRQRHKKLETGFTLIEVMITLFIFAIISVGTMTSLTSALKSKAQLTEKLAAQSELATALTLLRTDFLHRINRPLRDEYGQTLSVDRSNGNTLITFLRAGRLNPQGLEARSELQRVAYLFENGQFIRRHWAAANPAPNTPVTDRVLLEDLSNVGILPSASLTSGTRTDRPSGYVAFTFKFQNVYAGLQ